MVSELLQGCIVYLSSKARPVEAVFPVPTTHNNRQLPRIGVVSP